MKKLNLLTILSFLTLGIGSLFAQQTVTGTVRASGIPLPGVSVVEQGTVNGVTSDFDGNFSITLKNDNSQLVFSYIGYLTQTVGASATMNVVMSEDVAQLEEVVVTGYGSTSKKSLTGSIGTIASESLTQKPAANTTQLLVGQVAGLSSRSIGGLPGYNQANLSIRNFGSALVLVDGVETFIGQIDPNDIQSISSTFNDV